MDLRACPTEVLLQELATRGTHGVAAMVSDGVPRMEVWWGERVVCLGLVMRLGSSVNLDMDRADEPEEDTVDPEESDLSLEFPQIGQYL